MRARGVTLLASSVAIATASAIVSTSSLAATSHRFTASYTGHASGQVTGSEASGSATASGRGRLIGTSTLRASARGSLAGQCVDFTGTVVLRGTPGAIKLAIRAGHACSGTAPAVSFSGSAKVTRGTSTFAGARGTLSFTGRYVQQTGAVTISFKGRISY